MGTWHVTWMHHMWHNTEVRWKDTSHCMTYDMALDMWYNSTFYITWDMTWHDMWHYIWHVISHDVWHDKHDMIWHAKSILLTIINCFLIILITIKHIIHTLYMLCVMWHGMHDTTCVMTHMTCDMTDMTCNMFCNMTRLDRTYLTQIKE